LLGPLVFKDFNIIIQSYLRPWIFAETSSKPVVFPFRVTLNRYYSLLALKDGSERLKTTRIINRKTDLNRK